ncbi:hypothetical protein N5K55_21825 [Pseudomonas aeruginosa]|nr:hypothetical protein [Pseudomonas aeruginosa]
MLRPATLSQEIDLGAGGELGLPLATLRQDLASAPPPASWVLLAGNTLPGAAWPRRRRRAGCCHWRTLRQDLASAPPASWVLPLATLCQDLASAPPASWVLPLATPPGPGLGAAGELGVATGNTPCQDRPRRRR